MQDTIIPKAIVLKDTLKQLNESTIQRITLSKDSLPVYHKPYHPPEIPLTGNDASAVCERSAVADITFSDSLNFIRENKLIKTDRFPIFFTEKNMERHLEARAYMIKHLKSGESITVQPFHSDWLIPVIIFGAFIYSVIRTTSKNLLPEVTRFFFFRGINDPGSRDMGGLFNWQATLLNLITFFNIGLFSYCAAEWFEITPEGMSGFLIWMIAVGIIIAAVTLRHIVCVLTGSISDQKELFREYLLGVYQSYRFSGLILLVIVILIIYTHLLPVKLLIFSGFFILALMYMIRVIRLFLIFINRNISIFYLILYLCSLEILPVLILLKYSAGLI